MEAYPPPVQNESSRPASLQSVGCFLKPYLSTGTPPVLGKMFILGRLKPFRFPARLDQYLNQHSPLFLATVIIFVLVHGSMLIQPSNGGSDLVDADIPKSLMLLNGQNPYSVQPWASPYPPLLLLIDSAIIRFTSLFTLQSSTDAISQNIRIIGLVADATVAILIYHYLRGKTADPLPPLLSASLFLTLPALSISPLYFFHSDTFGYPILALSLVALAAHRYLIGTSLLATATIFKIHPILALPLVLVWQARNRGLGATLPSIISTGAILTVGLLLPLVVPGYAQSVLGFNLGNNGSSTTLSNTLSLFNDILLGLLAWLIPLKIEYTHYAAWAIIPVLMRGRIRQTIPVLGLLQLGDSLSYWTWWPNTSPLPGLDSFYGLLTASIVYRTLGIVALGFVLYSLREKTHGAPPVAVDGEPSRLLVEGY